MIFCPRVWRLGEPFVYGFPTKPPVPPHLLPWDSSLLGKLVDRGPWDSQIGGDFIDGHDGGIGLVHGNSLASGPPPGERRLSIAHRRSSNSHYCPLVAACQQSETTSGRSSTLQILCHPRIREHHGLARQVSIMRGLGAPSHALTRRTCPKHPHLLARFAPFLPWVRSRAKCRMASRLRTIG
jgi:hypothetical protein